MLDWYFGAITSLLGSATSGVLTLSIAGFLVFAYAIGTTKNPVKSTAKVLFWTSLSLAAIGIITNSYIKDYDKKHARTIITCASTNVYKPMTFDHNVSVYHTTISSRFGYGLYSQEVEVWTDNGERCNFMNAAAEIFDGT